VSIPTMKSVSRELNAWKEDSDSRIVTRATNVLERLTLLTKEREVEANLLADELVNIIIKPVDEADYKPEFISALYKAIQLIGFICPRNQTEDAEVMDPITLEKIQSTNLFISCDRYQFSKTELIRWNVNQMDVNEATYRNPVTRQAFNAFDQRVLTAARERAQNSAQERMSNFMSGCLGFFSRRPRPQEQEPRRRSHFSAMISHSPEMAMMAGIPPVIFVAAYSPHTAYSADQQRNHGMR